MQTISIDQSTLKSLLVLATVIEARDHYTGGHTWRVGRYASILADEAGFSLPEIFITYLGSIVHDIGKVGIPDAVLNKPAKLTDAEYEIIKRHPASGAVLVRDHPLGVIVSDVVTFHHERYDGDGYPTRISGDKIPPWARVVALADAFDAMTSARPYQEGKSPEMAFDILLKESGRQFDPLFTSLFVEIGRQGRLNPIIAHSAQDRPMMPCPTCGPTIVVPKHAWDGEAVYCPACTGKYVLHAHGSTFEVQWTGLLEPALMPEPDIDTIDEVVQSAPAQVTIAG